MSFAATDKRPAVNFLQEFHLCTESLAYYCTNYGKVQNGDGEWIDFRLWPKQVEVANDFDAYREIVCLKARQEGLSWLAAHEVLRDMQTRPGVKCGLFSLRETEAKKLLQRVKHIYNLQPNWLKPKGGVTVDAATEWRLANGSECMAFSTSSGDSYTLGLAVVDEADLIPNLDALLRSVRPTINAGGKIRLISRSNKSLPNSMFKKVYIQAERGENGYKAIFLPWSARPDRTQQWYEDEKRKSLAETGSLDYVYEQYPATAVEALMANSQDKRIPYEWVAQCFKEAQSITDGPYIPGLVVFKSPEPNRRYVCGADTAEGNPTSDDSTSVWGDLLTGEEMASLTGKFEPTVHAAYTAEISRWFNKSPVLPERNNHGGTFILAMKDYPDIPVLYGFDSKQGWVTGAKSKSMMWSDAADDFRNGQTIIHSHETFLQLTSIEGHTLRAPPKMHDDRAIAFALMLKAAAFAANTRWVGPGDGIKQAPPKPALSKTATQSKVMFGIDTSKKKFFNQR